MTNDATPPTVQRFFRAMQAGATAEGEIRALFAEDAVYLDPFSGRTQTHHGREAIVRTFIEGWKYPLPEMTLHVDRLSIEREQVTVDWTCRSPALPGGQGQGTNVFTLRAGQIVRLETTVKGPSEPS